jgi:hypothetical protein
MHRKPPHPLAQAFVLCRMIYEDRRTGEILLVGPFSGIELNFFPAGYRFALYSQLSSGHGSYRLGLQLRDAELEVRWSWQWPEPQHIEDPLEPFRVILHDLIVPFPHPGRFFLTLLAHGEDLAQHTIDVRAVAPR